MGPMGMGPMSGRTAGYCAGSDRPGFASPWVGRGRGWGFGRGGGGRGHGFGGGRRGFRWAGPAYWTPWDTAGGPVPDPGLERQVLKSQADVLRAQLQAIESRLAESDEKKEKPE
jgi:hypothetical protein